ncbi:MAG: pseudaminic acid synthase [Alphaproteobacteria bacterium]|nr:MAG: pseudaminic acid synthase [Alphaproteobacteria bacterium]
MEIDGRLIGPQHPPYIIAELSANHNGSLDRALQSIVAAKEAGADAVKIQSYTADTITIDHQSDDFMIRDGGLWDGYSLYELYKWAQTPFEWHEAMFAKAREVGITIFSTPFDHTAVDLLESLGAPAYKIASFEAIDIPLIRRVAQTGKPMIISTGMANEEEIGLAVKTARDNGCEQLSLLHCISSYPAPAEQFNLRTITDLGARFGVVPGLSDHSLGTTVAVVAVALGACIIEKHFMLDDGEEGPDSAFSLTDKEIKILCDDSRVAWQALGRAGYERAPAEENSLRFRRSLYFVEDMKAADVITSQNMRSIRPGFGIAPRFYDDVIGKRVSRDITRGTPVSFDLITQ